MFSSLKLGKEIQRHICVCVRIYVHMHVERWVWLDRTYRPWKVKAVIKVNVHGKEFVCVFRVHGKPSTHDPVNPTSLMLQPLAVVLPKSSEYEILSPLITPIILPYMIPYITLFKEFRPYGRGPYRHPQSIIHWRSPLKPKPTIFLYYPYITPV